MGLNLMDLFFVGFLIIVFWGVKLAPKGEFAEDVLSKERGNVLRGVFIFGIMLHHLSQRTDNGKLFWIFLYVGSLAVGIYLFLSGYGLMKQYRLRGEAYLSSFLVKRMSKILIPYLIANIMYIIGYTLLGKKIRLMEVLKSFTTGDPFVLFSWYMISIFFFYLEFYLVHRFCKKKLLVFWGHISFEVFLYHGFMVTLFKTRGFRVTNDVLMSLGVIIGGTLLGFLFSKVDQLILKKLIKA